MNEMAFHRPTRLPGCGIGSIKALAEEADADRLWADDCGWNARVALARGDVADERAGERCRQARGGRYRDEFPNLFPPQEP